MPHRREDAVGDLDVEAGDVQRGGRVAQTGRMPSVEFAALLVRTSVAAMRSALITYADRTGGNRPRREPESPR
ncbi:hypothetical protein [Streptomyces sp. NPDC102462]|uniref:hypothetical protein n=1 Tax=Streptomyces sp. NPDC102462 TaxID=3366178 RepID=UPI00380D569E